VAGTAGAETSARAARNPAAAEPATATAMEAPRRAGEPAGVAEGAVLVEEGGAAFGLMRVGVVMASSCGCGGGEWRDRRLVCEVGRSGAVPVRWSWVLLAIGEEL
jgi:hypothetical protein